MSDEGFPTGKSLIEPEWLLDAWQAGISRFSLRSHDELIKEIQQRLDKGNPSPGTWDFWNLASIMALLGWKEVKRASESDSETDREEDDRDPAGE